LGAGHTGGSPALGRHSAGSDISALAEFVAKTKTTLLTDAELARLERWPAELTRAVNVSKPSIYFAAYDELATTNTLVVLHDGGCERPSSRG